MQIASFQTRKLRGGIGLHIFDVVAGLFEDAANDSGVDQLTTPVVHRELDRIRRLRRERSFRKGHEGEATHHQTNTQFSKECSLNREFLLEVSESALLAIPASLGGA